MNELDSQPVHLSHGKKCGPHTQKFHNHELAELSTKVFRGHLMGYNY
jgi:hypothetical protein